MRRKNEIKILLSNQRIRESNFTWYGAFKAKRNKMEIQIIYSVYKNTSLFTYKSEIRVEAIDIFFQ